MSSSTATASTAASLSSKKQASAGSHQKRASPQQSPSDKDPRYYPAPIVYVNNEQPNQIRIPDVVYEDEVRTERVIIANTANIASPTIPP